MEQGHLANVRRRELGGERGSTRTLQENEGFPRAIKEKQPVPAEIRRGLGAAGAVRYLRANCENPAGPGKEGRASKG